MSSPIKSDAAAPSAAGPSSNAVILKVSMPREHGSGFMTIRIESDSCLLSDLKRQLLEKVRVKRVSITGMGDVNAPSPPPAAISEAALAEYGLTLYDEAAANAASAPLPSKAASASSSAGPRLPAFLPEHRTLAELRSQFASQPIWKLSLLSRPKKEQGTLIEGYLKKKSSSRRLMAAWQRRFFRLTNRSLSYWLNESDAQIFRGSDGSGSGEARTAEPPKAVFPVSGFHEAVTAIKTKGPGAAAADAKPAMTRAASATVSSSSPPASSGPAASVAPRGRVARQASVSNINLDSTRVRLGPWGQWIFILEFPGRTLELQAADKADFQKWLNAFFGRGAYTSALAASPDAAAEDQAPPSLARAPSAEVASTVASSVVASGIRRRSMLQSSPILQAAMPSIPVESRIGALDAEDDGSGSREPSLSARDILKRAAGLDDDNHAGAGGASIPLDADNFDSEDSMSQVWEADGENGESHAVDFVADTSGGAQVEWIANGASTGAAAAGAIPIDDDDSSPSISVQSSAQPTPHTAPASAAASIPVEDFSISDQSDSSDDDESSRSTSSKQRSHQPTTHARLAPAVAPAPAARSAGAPPVVSAYPGPPPPVPSSPPPRVAPYPGSPPPQPPQPASPPPAFVPAAAPAVPKPAPMPASPAAPALAPPAAAAAPTQPAFTPAPAPAPAPAPTSSGTGGMFAGGFGGAAGVGAGGFRGSMIGSSQVASAALLGSVAVAAVASPAHARTRSESLSAGLSPMAVQRRPSMDLSTGFSPVVQPASGSELNFSPTLQRRLSHSGPLATLPPLPAGPPPASALSPAELAAKRRAEEAAAAEAEAEAERLHAEEKRAKKEAQAANLRNIRAYLEAEAAADRAKATAAAAGPPPTPPLPPSSPASPPPPSSPPQQPPPMPAPFPGSSPLSPSSALTPGIQDVRELDYFRASLGARPPAEVVEIATRQAREILELKLRIKEMMKAQQQTQQ